jgi:GNAT superfamily N-acetyltransferase
MDRESSGVTEDVPPSSQRSWHSSLERGEDNGFVIQLQLDRIPTSAQLVGLYSSVEWATYVAEPDRLVLALSHSLRVATAWADDSLIGLARVVGDGVSVVYLQDILVRPDHQGRGVGKRLINAVFEPYFGVRQHVLLTDDEPEQRAFYESVGFTEAHDFEPRQLRSFVRFQG